MMKFLTFLTLGLLAVGVKPETCSNLYGNSLKGECKEVGFCTGGAFIGNCRNRAHICCVDDVTSIESKDDDFIIKRSVFFSIVGKTPRNQLLYNYFIESMQIASIDNTFRAAAYLSQLAAETRNFEQLESEKPELDNNALIGNSKIGDGARFRGRGAIFLRGKLNYELATIKIKSELF